MLSREDSPSVGRLFFGLLLISFSVPFIFAQNQTVAVLPLENSTGDTRSDYLGKIAEALLMFDLASQKDVELVSRSELDSVMQEQRLALSGLTDENSELREIGGLTGAGYLISGEYVHLGDDILFNIRLISVESGEVIVVRERGTDENTVHRVSEKLLAGLTGSTPTLENKAGTRSIISMKNEEPGSLHIFSHLIDAQIFLDDEFVGYTTGVATHPFILDQVRPGPHIVKTHLSKNFGVVELPEIRFKDWQTEVIVRPGARTVIRDESRHFNNYLYELQWLIREEYDFQTFEELSDFEAVLAYEFTDRDGRLRRGSLTAVFIEEGPVNSRSLSSSDSSSTGYLQNEGFRCL
ncbi:MAG: CsgG/HfaB family protein [Spirochaetia bacterium]|nr:CsgG/HfaB family protein [Spirochaetia bacterium]